MSEKKTQISKRTRSIGKVLALKTLPDEQAQKVESGGWAPKVAGKLGCQRLQRTK